MKQGLFTLGLSVALSIMAGCRSQQEGWKSVSYTHLTLPTIA